MRQRIENNIKITVGGVDLTTLSQLEFYIRQDDRFFQYTPRVLNAEELLVTVPLEDALRLMPGRVKLQLAFLTQEGVPDASGIAEVPVEEFLKERGYEPK